MTSRQGASQAGGQGGREFSLTTSAANFPAPSRQNDGQGGTTPLTLGAGKPPVTHRRTAAGKPPSLRATTDADLGEIQVDLPNTLPPLSTPVCRALLAILVELTAVEVLDGPAGEGTE
jgi:hypothetical protein